MTRKLGRASAVRNANATRLLAARGHFGSLASRGTSLADRITAAVRARGLSRLMCLAVPGEVIATFDEHQMRFATVRFGAIERSVCIHAHPEVEKGDFVLVHVGFALAVISAEEAQRSLAVLRQLGELEAGDDGELDPLSEANEEAVA